METRDGRERNASLNSTAESAEGPTEVTNNDDKISRRKALIAGLVSAPVILTLMNRSAWGAGNCSTATVTSWQNQGQPNPLTTSFQNHHPNAFINPGGNLKCN